MGACSFEHTLDRLLRFYHFEQKYRPSLRTTNPIELNKEFKTPDQGDGDNRWQAEYLSPAGGCRVDHKPRGRRWYVLSLPKPFYSLKAA
jgi:hypothetical protein